MSRPARPRRGREAALANPRGSRSVPGRVTHAPDGRIHFPDDETLTVEGAEFARNPDRGAGRVLLVACGALAREVIAVTAANGLDRFDLTCLPALLHNTPERIPAAVREKIHQAKSEGYASIFILYADCGTGGLLDRVCEAEGVERIAGPHCYSFFDGNDAFAERAEAGEEMRAFYLTDFLARQFDTLIWKGMGLDRHPDLRDMYFGHYERVVHLAQTEDPVLDAKARAAAERLGLAYERRFTGYGDLAAFLTRAAPGAEPI